VTFPWGVDISHFSPAPESQADDTMDLRTRLGWQGCFVVISTRSWEPGYGVDELVRGFIQAARTHPELRLLLLGAGSQAGLLRRMTLQANIQGVVNFVGQVSQRESPDYFRAADLYISASHSDGSSISLLEALATGTPALVSDIPGNLEWIQDSEQGWIFKKGDVTSLAQALLHAVDARERLPLMRRAARALAENRADWTSNYQELLRAYRLAQM
jgi:glycosyltransferase involved in cell wall biosynthesis